LADSDETRPPGLPLALPAPQSIRDAVDAGKGLMLIMEFASPRTEEWGFWAAIAAAPDDDLPKLVFADWLEGRGDRRASCVRWLVAEHKRPAFDRIDTKTWDWWSRVPAEPIHYDIPPSQYVLPVNLFTRMPPSGTGLWKAATIPEEAFWRVGYGWTMCERDGVDALAGDKPFEMHRA
jgi:uncharacterized protein (TIGR02996 family)